jgi:hypothetical protein
MNNILKDIKLEELYAEIKRREDSGEIENFKLENKCAEIRNLKIKDFTTQDAVVKYYIESRDKYNNGGPYFQFYFNVNNKLKDFYYGNHGLEYDEWQGFIPSFFGESSENCYEYHGEGYVKGIYGFLEKLSEEEYVKALDSTLKGALAMLSKCGYKTIKQIEPYD